MELTYTMKNGLAAQPDARTIREEVFVREQGFLDEFDAIDAFAHTLVVYADGVPAATGRLFCMADDPVPVRTGTEDLSSNETYILGRIAVRAPYRGLRLGGYVMDVLEAHARACGARHLWLHAQEQARPFYERAGFRAIGDTEWEEHCPHISMYKAL